MRKTRFLFQLLFVLLVARLVLGLGQSDFEKWCPFGGLESLYLFATDGSFPCSLGSSNLYLLLGILFLTVLSRRTFCGWICPLGALSEWGGKVKDKVFPGKRWAPPEGIDVWLRKVKYLGLVLIVYFTWKEGELIFRAFDPYYAIASNHGEDISWLAYFVLALVFVGAFFMRQPFCRYLCPLAALLDPFGFLAPIRISRSEAACTDCGVCDEACDQGILVSRMDSVDCVRCTQCLECLSACPKKDALFVSIALPGGKKK